MAELGIVLALTWLSICIHSAAGVALGGHVVRGCFNDKNMTLRLLDANTGQITAESQPVPLEGAATNLQSISLDVLNKKIAWTAKQTSDSKIYTWNYTVSSVTLDTICTLPPVASNTNGDPLEAHCVVYSDERLFVVYDKPFGNGIVSELHSDTCTFTELAISPSRVRGSLYGPGGDCVAIPDANKLVWTQERSLNSDKRLFRIITFDYMLSTFTSFDYQVGDHSSGSSSVYTSLVSTRASALLILSQPGRVYEIASFHPTNAAPPTVFSVTNVSLPTPSPSVAAITYTSVDPSTSPHRFVRVGAASASPGVYTDKMELLQALPPLQVCSGPFLEAYDYALKPYAPLRCHVTPSNCGADSPSCPVRASICPDGVQYCVAMTYTGPGTKFPGGYFGCQSPLMLSNPPCEEAPRGQGFEAGGLEFSYACCRDRDRCNDAALAAHPTSTTAPLHNEGTTVTPAPTLAPAQSSPDPATTPALPPPPDLSLFGVATLRGMTLTQFTPAAESAFSSAVTSLLPAAAALDLHVLNLTQDGPTRRLLEQEEEEEEEEEAVTVEYEVTGFASESTLAAATTTLMTSTPQLLDILQAHGAFSSLRDIQLSFKNTPSLPPPTTEPRDASSAQGLSCVPLRGVRVLLVLLTLACCRQ